MSEYRPWKPGPDDLVIPFVFVPHGAPEPTEWMKEHPGWVKFPATLVLRPDGSDPTSAALGTTAVAGAGASGLGGAFGEAFTEFLLEELKKAAPALAAADVALRPTPTASPDIDEIPLETRLRLRREATEGHALAPSIPALPGIAAPAPDAVPPPDGVEAARSLPKQPGLTPATPLPPLPPSQPAEQSGPTILQQDRNEGLGNGLRTNSQRAREAARKADPTVTTLLQEADWRAHHVINLATIREDRDLLVEAAKAGWRTDDVRNIAPLPANTEAQRKLDSAGVKRPVHNSGHGQWNSDVAKGLADVRQTLRAEGLLPGMDAYARRVRELLEVLQDRLRKKLLESGRLTQNDTIAEDRSES